VHQSELDDSGEDVGEGDEDEIVEGGGVGNLGPKSVEYHIVAK
jgi:hypothetical protein